MIVIDIAKLRGYKWCARGILAAVFRCRSLWFRSEFSGCEKSSALDGVVKPSSLLPGSTDADRALVWRTPVCRWTVMLLGALGVLAFLVSAVLPDDDAWQQECLHGRASIRILGQHTRKAVGDAASVHTSAAFGPAAKPRLLRPHGIAWALYIAPVSVSERLQSTARATRAPPLSV
jgi:hypothetical protein